MKPKKLILIIVAILALIGIVIGAVTIGKKLKKEKEAEELQQAFRLENLLGRWVSNEQGYSFLIYKDRGGNYRIRSDIFYDKYSGTGMFDSRAFQGGSHSFGAQDSYSSDYIFFDAVKMLDKDGNSFEVNLRYQDHDDQVVGDENLSINYMKFTRASNYYKMIDGADRFTASTIEEIMNLLNNACTSYYNIDVAIMDMELNQTGTDGLYGEPVDYDGFICGTGIIAPVSGGVFQLGSNQIKFAIDPTTYPMTIYTLYNITSSDRIVFQYVPG